MRSSGLPDRQGSIETGKSIANVERERRLAEIVSAQFISDQVISRLPEFRGMPPPTGGLCAVVRGQDTAETSIEYQVNGTPVAFGKLYPDISARQAYGLLSGLWDTGLDLERRYRVAEPIGLIVKQNLLLTRTPPGVNLVSLLSGDAGDAVSGVQEAAKWIAKLHSAETREEDADQLWGLYARLADRLSGVLASHPEELDMFRTMIAQLEHATSQLWKRTPVRSHGHFIPANVYLEEDAVTAVDLDASLASDPARDVADFVLSLRAAERGSRPSVRPESLSRAFLDEYARQRPLELDALPFYLGVRILVSLCEDAFATDNGGSSQISAVGLYRSEFEEAMLGRTPPLSQTSSQSNADVLTTSASQALQADFIRRFVAPSAASNILGDPLRGNWEASIIRDIGSGRVTVRYELEGKPQVFGKLYSDAIKARFGFDVLRTLWDHGFDDAGSFQVSEPLAYIPDHRIVLIRAIDGISFEDAIRDGASDLAKDARLAARWLAELHRSPVRIGEPDPPWFSMRLYPLLRRLMKAVVSAPDERGNLMKLVDAFCLRAKQTYRQAPRVQSHGRFHHEHIFFAPSKVSVIDFDTSTPSDPSKDLAEFLSCLRSFTFKLTGSVSLAEGPTRAFLDEYVSLMPGYADNLALHWAADVMGSMIKKLRKQWAKNKYDPDRFDRLMGFFQGELDAVLGGELLRPFVSRRMTGD